VRDDGQNTLRSRKDDFVIENPLGDDPEVTQEFSTGIYSLFSTPVDALLKNNKFEASDIGGPTLSFTNVSAEAIGPKIDTGSRMIGYTTSSAVDAISDSLMKRYDGSPFASRGEITGRRRNPTANLLSFNDPLSKWMLEQEIELGVSRPMLNRMDVSKDKHLVLAQNGSISLTGKIIACVPLE